MPPPDSPSSAATPSTPPPRRGRTSSAIRVLPSPFPDELFAARLVAAGLLTLDQVEQLRAEQATARVSLRQLALAKGLVGREEVDRVFSAPRASRARAAPRRPAPSERFVRATGPSDIKAPGDLPRGSSIGRYVVLQTIASGGAGTVYRCYDPTRRRMVAVKLIRLTGATPTARERFRREADIAAKLRHRSIVALHEVGEHDGKPFLVMDYIDGESLDKVVERAPMSAVRAAEIARDVADALDYAHGEGVIHRDVKPHNIVMDGAGRVYLIDFGLARLLSDAHGRITSDGQALGTPYFMSPEQARGDRKNTGPASDVYSLGAVLFFLLTRQPPFTGKRLFEVCTKVIRQPAPAPRSIDASIPPALDELVRRCLEKERAARPPSAAAIGDELDEFLDAARGATAIDRDYALQRADTPHDPIAADSDVRPRGDPGGRLVRIRQTALDLLVAIFPPTRRRRWRRAAHRVTRRWPYEWPAREHAVTAGMVAGAVVAAVAISTIIVQGFGPAPAPLVAGSPATVQAEPAEAAFRALPPMRLELAEHDPALPIAIARTVAVGAARRGGLLVHVRTDGLSSAGPDGAAPARLRLSLADADRPDGWTASLGEVATGAGWSRVSAELAIPDAVARVRLTLALEGVAAPATGTIWLDETLLLPTADAIPDAAPAESPR